MAKFLAALDEMKKIAGIKKITMAADERASGKRAIPYTKEPGSWVMFLAAFSVGSAVSGRFVTMSVIVFVSLALMLLAKSPAVSMVRGRKWEFLPDVFVLVLPAFAGIFYSAWLYPPLGLLYGAGAALFALNYYFEGRRSRFPRVYAEACGMAIMGLIAAIASSVAGGIPRHLYLWAVFSLFYFASSFRVRYANSPGYRRAGAVYSGLLIFGGIAAAALGHPVFLAFAPLAEDFYSSLKTGRGKLKFRQIGLISTAKVLVFAVLVIALGR
ncbi:MAG: YwiC-like family protein [Nitrospiraceae bacterium]|nr:YwiC-like family protein [Nitrospiraceae bacterium]